MKIIILFYVLFFATGSFAISPEKQIENPILEARAQDLFKQVRCVSCTSESIKDSKAILAQNMKYKIRSLIIDNKSNTEILSYLKGIYGNDILMKPPIVFSTLILWFLPITLIFLGLWIVKCINYK